MEEHSSTRTGSATVKWFNNSKGYGFLIDENGDDIFVHYRSISGEGYRYLNDGQKVRYTAFRSEKGWQASEVIPD